MKTKPNIPDYLLWEYDLTTFNYEKSYKIVIERILQLGNIENWKEMLSFYPFEKIIETLNWSKQLTTRDKQFVQVFLKSDFLNAA